MYDDRYDREAIEEPRKPCGKSCRLEKSVIKRSKPKKDKTFNRIVYDYEIKFYLVTII